MCSAHRSFRIIQLLKMCTPKLLSSAAAYSYDERSKNDNGCVSLTSRPPPAYLCISQLTRDADNVQSSRPLIRPGRVTYQNCFDWHFSTHVNLADVLSTVDLEIHLGGRRVLAFKSRSWICSFTVVNRCRFPFPIILLIFFLPYL